MRRESEPTEERALSEAERARLESLLDEALSPVSVAGPMPAELNNRILAATRGELSHLRRKSVPGMTGVLARIGPQWGSAIAAVWAVAISLGVFLQFGPGSASALGVTPATARAIEQGLQRAGTYRGPATPIDRDLRMLAVQMDASANLNIETMGEALLNSTEHLRTQVESVEAMETF